MNWLRNSLIGGILIVLFLLVIRWNEYQERQLVEVAEATSEETISATPAPEIPSAPKIAASDTEVSDSDIPDAPVEKAVSQQDSEISAPDQSYSKLISAKSDTLEVLIDTLGGDIVKVALLKHQAKLEDSEKPFILLNRTEAHTYVAQSGLVGPNGTDVKGARPIFTTQASEYQIREDEDTLVVDLIYQQEQAEITKRFTLSRGSYLINVDYLINNKSSAPWKANFFAQIKRDDYDPIVSTAFSMKPYLGAAITTPETNYKKITFEELDEKAEKVEIDGGWVAMIQHYFISAWVPEAKSTNTFNLRKSRGKDVYLLGFTSNRTTVAPGSIGEINTSFYAGPKDIRTLAAISPHLDLTMDFGWLWMIAKPLFLALGSIHEVVGNWGVAIILLTFAIKLLFFYPSAMSYRSMAKMRKIQPMMQELKERYPDDRQRMSSELMKLYKKEKVNPLGGCLPVLLQMPVFIALYWVLMESVELRHAPFMLWIEDLSVRDPYFVLPLIMGATSYIQFKLNPTPPDPMQAKVMQMMPIFFTILFMMFPAGLVLYWVVNNTLSITQQYVITRQIEKAD
ncbi:protein translocase subunit yidC [Alteromonadaceae bacterium Bs31]|nr:protein translocase subunit yidC [Alteromonadaceae bacterium Bs31]